MKKLDTFLIIVACTSVLIIGCSTILPEGDYQTSSYETINRSNHTELKRALSVNNVDSIYTLNFNYWNFLNVEDKSYLTVFARHKGSRVFFHILVEDFDDNLRELKNVGGYRHALIKGLQWEYKIVDGVEEMCYNNIRKIID